MTPTPQPQEAVIPSEGLSSEDHAVIQRCCARQPKLYQRGVTEGLYLHSDIADLINIIGRDASASTCGIAPLGDEPKPSTREAEAPVSEAVAWRVRCGVNHPLVEREPFAWRVSETYPEIGQGAKPEWFDLEPLYTHPAPSPASAWKPGREAVAREISIAMHGYDECREQRDQIVDIAATRILALPTPPATEWAGE